MGNEFKHLLTEFRKLNLKELPSSTFLDIVEKSHLENVWSRILAFYFDPNNVHRMKDLMIKSLFDAIKKPKTFHSLHSYNVQTEYPTNKSNRIDIVITSSEFVIGIENKVNAYLYNDLKDYGNAIKTIANKRESILIILSKNKIEISNDHEEYCKENNITICKLTYKIFLESIRNNIGYYQGYADTKYLIFFLDFLDNIEKNINLINMINNPEAMKFFIDNNEDVTKLVSKYNLISKEINESFIALHSKIKADTDLQSKFREIIPNENFILEIYKPELREAEKNLWVIIKLKEQNLKIVDCLLSFENYYWFAYPDSPNSLFKPLLNDIFRGEMYSFNDLEPWIELSIIEQKFVDIILNAAEVVKQYEDKIIEIVSSSK